MAKIQQREKAVELRKRGASIGEIAKTLHVAKSSVSGWCRDIILTHSAIKKIVAKGKTKSVEGLLRYSEKVRQKRVSETKLSSKIGRDKIGILSDRDIYCIGLGLYWGEGYKQGSQEFGFTNSDPGMIAFYLRWLNTVFGVTREQLILRVSINNAHASRVDQVVKYWSQHTGVPLTQFTKTSLLKSRSKKVYKNRDSHMGTLRVKVRKGTAFRREVIGAISSIAL